LNIGDSYNGSGATGGQGKQHTNAGSVGRPDARGGYVGLKQKDLIGIPWMLAFALRADGWYLRQDIIWHKPNPMPESVTDRCTKSHEYIFLLSKSPRYYYDADAIKEDAKPESAARYAYAFGGPPKEAVGKYGATRPEGSRIYSETRNKRSVWTVTTKPYSGAHFATFPPDLIEPCILAGAPAGGVVLDPFMGSGTTAAVAIKHGRGYLGCELNPAYEELQQERIRDATLSVSQMSLENI